MALIAQMAFIARKHRAALLAIAIAATVLTATPAMAGCNSGNVADTDLLSSANCQASASGVNALAVGIAAQATGGVSTAIGSGATASGNTSAAVGNGATASGGNSSAYGAGAEASGSNSSAYGEQSVASGLNSATYGSLSTASGTNSSAYGIFSTASGTNSAAYGAGSNASGASSVAIGLNANATAANSVAIGAGSLASAPNTVSFGAPGNERRLTNVAAGISPTDAVNVSQLQSVAAGLQQQIDTNQKEARRGIAAAVATANAPMPSMPGRTTWQLRTSHFAGETGVGFGMAHRLNTSVPLAIIGGYGNGGGREHTGYVGLGGEF